VSRQVREPEVRPAAPRPSLACIMPALNEEANLERSVLRVVAALEKHADSFEVIVIDDGSSDRTGEIAARLADEDPRIRVLRNDSPASYGVALLQGIRAARSEWVFHDGMDLPLAPEDLGLFVPRLADSDVVVACRISRAAHSRWRRLTSWTNNLLLRLLFAPRTRDLNFTQFYRRDFVLATRLVNLGPASVTPELILRAERTGLRVREVPVEFRRREAGRAHFGRLTDILWTLVDLGRLRIRTWRGGWQ